MNEAGLSAIGETASFDHLERLTEKNSHQSKSSD
jgi:hypothetical protein